MFASIKQRIRLLQGLMDTDGCCDKKGSVSFSTSSEKLKNDFVALVQSLGGIAYITKKLPTYFYKGEKKTGKINYTIHINLPNNIRPFKLNRKMKRVKNARNIFLFGISLVLN